MVDFKSLYSINVNENVEKKNGLSYLSWAWAWAEFMKQYPQAEYEIVKFNGLPYAYDPNTGYMVYTKVTVDGQTREMWLPVMDGANRAMKAEPYIVTNKWGKESTVEAATMFDINKTIMRCLVKNLAMFGLGLYIYAGEDLPEDETPAKEVPKTKKSEPKAEPKKATNTVIEYIATNATEEELKMILQAYNIDLLENLTAEQADKCIKAINKRKVEKGNVI